MLSDLLAGGTTKRTAPTRRLDIAKSPRSTCFRLLRHSLQNCSYGLPPGHQLPNSVQEEGASASVPWSYAISGQYMFVCDHGAIRRAVGAIPGCGRPTSHDHSLRDVWPLPRLNRHHSHLSLHSST